MRDRRESGRNAPVPVPINGRVAQCALREIMQLRSSGSADYLPNRHGPEKRDSGSGGEPAPPRSMGPCGTADPHSGEDGFTQAGRRLHFAQFRTDPNPTPTTNLCSGPRAPLRPFRPSLACSPTHQSEISTHRLTASGPEVCFGP